jgi:hypothetical protein
VCLTYDCWTVFALLSRAVFNKISTSESLNVMSPHILLQPIPILWRYISSGVTAISQQYYHESELWHHMECSFLTTMLPYQPSCVQSQNTVHNYRKVTSTIHHSHNSLNT